ncbi:MAG: L-threonylcarbamoyladenylate synthase [Patescibacteria group bacterium]
METLKQSPKALNRAVSILKNGGVVICPTDTVYGFLADAGNKKAVDKIYKIKKRTKSKPLSIFVKDLKMAKALAEISEKQEKILKKYWPGAYTFILKRLTRPTRPDLVGIYEVDENTIALRIPSHTFLQKLLKKINRPLVQTSVNISGQPPLIKIKDIIEKFSSIRVSETPMLIIDDGNLKNGKPSKIIDLTNSALTILR